MHFVEGTPRHQLIFFPNRSKSRSTPDNPVRFIDVFVEILDPTMLQSRQAGSK